jgi:hypothetical protein
MKFKVKNRNPHPVSKTLYNPAEYITVEELPSVERVAGVLLINDEELDRRLSEIEGRALRPGKEA